LKLAIPRSCGAVSSVGDAVVLESSTAPPNERDRCPDKRAVSRRRYLHDVMSHSGARDRSARRHVQGSVGLQERRSGCFRWSPRRRGVSDWCHQRRALGVHSTNLRVGERHSGYAGLRPRRPWPAGRVTGADGLGGRTQVADGEREHSVV